LGAILAATALLALAITGLLFQLVLSTGANRGRSSWQGLSQGAWCAVLVTALLGFVWGRVITGISANVEYALWLICIPAAAWVAWWTGPTLSKVFEIGKGVIVVLLLEAILAVFLAPFWQAVSWVAPGAIVTGGPDVFPFEPTTRS
jgi:hypothetical protein